MTRAASRTSRQVSSRREMARTMVPSCTSVSSATCAKGCQRQVAPGWELTHHAASPLEDDLGQAEAQRAAERLVGVGASGRLRRLDALGDADQQLLALGQPRRQDRLVVRFLGEDERGEQRDGFLRLERAEDVLEDDLGQDQLVRRVDLRRQRT